MATQRNAYPIEFFRGQNDQDNPTDQRRFAGEGYLQVCENYFLDRGLRKRHGHRKLIDEAAGGAAMQGLAMYEWDTTRYLVGLANGALKYLNGASWSSIAGSYAPTVDDEAYLRTAHFHDGTSRYLIGCLGAGNAKPFIWSGAGNVAELSGTGTPPTYAADVASFRNHVFFINTPSGVYTVQFGNYGLVNEWPTANNLLDCTRDSIGMGLGFLSAEVLLAFYQHSIHRITFNYGDSTTGNFFQAQGLPGEVGCFSRSSIVAQDGKVFFGGSEKGMPKGIYAIADPLRRPKYLSRPIEGFWNRLTKDRRQYLVAVPLPQSNSIAWLCSVDGSATHNAALIYNTEVDGWSIFNSPYGGLAFNAGCLWVNGDGQEVTVLGDYNGYANEAWGDAQYSTGYLDGGEAGYPVRSEFKTGFINAGSRRSKGWREVLLNMESLSEKTFDMTFDTVADAPRAASTLTMGVTGAKLSQTFVLGASKLVGEGLLQGKKKLNRSGRYGRLGGSEEGTGAPHTITSIEFKVRQQGARL